MARRKYFNPDLKLTSDYTLREDYQYDEDGVRGEPYDDAAKWKIRKLDSAEYGRVMDKSSVSKDGDVGMIPGTSCVLAFNLACVGWEDAGPEYSAKAKRTIDPDIAMEIGGEVIRRTRLTENDEEK